MPRITYLFLITSLLATPVSFALAQEENDPATQERIDHLEHDIQLLQKQVATGAASAPISNSDIAASGGAAQLEVRLSAIEDQIRELRGKNEENEFQLKKLNDSLEKMQKDNDFRFNDIQQHMATAAPTAPAPTPETPPRKPLNAEKPTAEEAPTGPTTAGDGVLHAPDDGDENPGSSPRDLYNYAFRLLNQTKYDDAATAFDSFTKKYPKDPLVGNAYYWEGETYYIRHDYVNAADNFRQGFEALPDGPKASDNLLKLAMSLDALNRDKEACIVLQQITTKFKKSAASITDKAIQEQKRIGCQ